MYDLNDYLDSSGAGWELFRGNGISDAGHITGAGTLNGQLHAFLLTPAVPETSSFLIMAAGGLTFLALSLLRRHRTV